VRIEAAAHHDGELVATRRWHETVPR